MFRYEVGYYDEYKDAEVIEKGLVAADSYVDAMSKLINPDTGYSEVFSVKLTDLCDSILNDDDLKISLK